MSQKGFLSDENFKGSASPIRIYRAIAQALPLPTYQHEIEIRHWPLLILMDFSNRTTGTILVRPRIGNPLISTCSKNIDPRL